MYDSFSAAAPVAGAEIVGPTSVGWLPLLADAPWARVGAVLDEAPDQPAMLQAVSKAAYSSSEEEFTTRVAKLADPFKKLDDAQKENLDATKAKALMLEQPSMIKRPVLDVDGTLTIGFKPETYQQTFKA